MIRKKYKEHVKDGGSTVLTAAWCYKWIGHGNGLGMDGSPGGVRYGAPCGANKAKNPKEAPTVTAFFLIMSFPN